MPSWGSYAHLYGPMVALIVLLALMLLLRWAFSRGSSVVARRPRPGEPHDYGLLVPVAAPATLVEAEVLRRTLDEAGVRCTVAQTLDGPRVMVLGSQRQVALHVLERR